MRRLFLFNPDVLNIEQLTLDDFHQLDDLEFLAKQVVEGFIIGMHKSPFHGFSVEFAEHRLYNPGESSRNIDWKVYARTNRLFTKKYEEETNLRCQIVIDASPSMYYPVDSRVNKIKFSVMASAALMNLFRKQRDAVGLSIFGDTLHTHTSAKTSNVHHRLLLSYLAETLSKDIKEGSTAASKSIHEVAEAIHKRSLVLIFSDMMENLSGPDHLEDVFSSLQHLKHNRHEVILFHVVDKNKELEFQFENRPYVFVDMETGEKVKVHTNQVREYYLEQMEEFRKKLKLKCVQYKIDFIEADINKDFTQVLTPYLLKRTKLF